MNIEIPDEFFGAEELKNTPGRFKKFMKEWLVDSKDFTFTVFENPGYDEIITWSGKSFSMCAHHLLPMILEVHVGYIPSDKICGLSKIPRVVDMFAHRPQLQERLTKEIADYLEEHLSPKGVIVMVKGRHLCVEARGVRKTDSFMSTSVARGLFLKPTDSGRTPKQEFFEMIRRKD